MAEEWPTLSVVRADQKHDEIGVDARRGVVAKSLCGEPYGECFVTPMRRHARGPAFGEAYGAPALRKHCVFFVERPVQESLKTRVGFAVVVPLRRKEQTLARLGAGSGYV